MKQANLTTLFDRQGHSNVQSKNNLLPKYLQDLFITQEEEKRRCILKNSDLIMPVLAR